MQFAPRFFSFPFRSRIIVYTFSLRMFCVYSFKQARLVWVGRRYKGTGIPAFFIEKICQKCSTFAVFCSLLLHVRDLAFTLLIAHTTIQDKVKHRPCIYLFCHEGCSKKKFQQQLSKDTLWCLKGYIISKINL